MAARTSTSKDHIVVSNKTGAFARPFLPSIDIVQPTTSVLGELTEADKKQLLVTKVAEITHFQVGLATIHEHVKVAIDLGYIQPPPSRPRLATPASSRSSSYSIRRRASSVIFPSRSS